MSTAAFFQAWRTRWAAIPTSVDRRYPPVRVRRRLLPVDRRDSTFQALGEKRWPKQNRGICRWRFWQIQNRPNPSSQPGSPIPPLQVLQPLPLCLPCVAPKKSPSLMVQLPGPGAMDLLQPLPDALLPGSPSVAFYVQSLQGVHAPPSFIPFTFLAPQ